MIKRKEEIITVVKKISKPQLKKEYSNATGYLLKLSDGSVEDNIEYKNAIYEVGDIYRKMNKMDFYNKNDYYTDENYLNEHVIRIFWLEELGTFAINQLEKIDIYPRNVDKDYFAECTKSNPVKKEFFDYTGFIVRKVGTNKYVLGYKTNYPDTNDEAMKSFIYRRLINLLMPEPLIDLDLGV